MSVQYTQQQFNEAAAFLAQLFPFETVGFMEVRSLNGRPIQKFFPLEWFHARRGSALEEVVAYCFEQDAGGRDVYVGVYPRGMEAGGNDAVHEARWIYADMDGAKVAPPACDIAVATGGGIHAYWRLPRPVVTIGRDRERFLRSLFAWQKRHGGDPGAKDLARILRVPGTHNHKPGRDHAPVTLIHCRPAPWAVAVPYGVTNDERFNGRPVQRALAF